MPLRGPDADDGRHRLHTREFTAAQHEIGDQPHIGVRRPCQREAGLDIELVGVVIVAHHDDQLVAQAGADQPRAVDGDVPDHLDGLFKRLAARAV